MTFGVFMHKDGSIYDDIPEVHYQFPKSYLSRAQQMVGDWIVYREPVKIPNSKGFFAVAKVEEIIPDPAEPDRFRAIIEKGSYLPFEPTVPHMVNGEHVEQGVLNEEGKVSGRAQAAVRPLSNSDFARIIALGLPDDDTLPRVDSPEAANRVGEEQTPFEIERPIVQSLVSRPFRDKAFRRAVLHAYDGRCAVTGWRLVNGGGRLEAEAAQGLAVFLLVRRTPFDTPLGLPWLAAGTPGNRLAGLDEGQRRTNVSDHVGCPGLFPCGQIGTVVMPPR